MKRYKIELVQKLLDSAELSTDSDNYYALRYMKQAIEFILEDLDEDAHPVPGDPSGEGGK